MYSYKYDHVELYLPILYLNSLGIFRHADFDFPPLSSKEEPGPSAGSGPHYRLGDRQERSERKRTEIVRMKACCFAYGSFQELLKAGET